MSKKPINPVLNVLRAAVKLVAAFESCPDSDMRKVYVLLHKREAISQIPSSQRIYQQLKRASLEKATGMKCWSMRDIGDGLEGIAQEEHYNPSYLADYLGKFEKEISADPDLRPVVRQIFHEIIAYLRSRLAVKPPGSTH